MLESLFNKVARLQACNFIKKILGHRCFPVINVKFLRTSILKDIYKRLLLIFRRYFGSSSLLAFCKIGVLKTSVKYLGKQICQSLFNKVLDL